MRVCYKIDGRGAGPPEIAHPRLARVLAHHQRGQGWPSAQVAKRRNLSQRTAQPPSLHQNTRLLYQGAIADEVPARTEPRLGRDTPPPALPEVIEQRLQQITRDVSALCHRQPHQQCNGVQKCIDEHRTAA